MEEYDKIKDLKMLEEYLKDKGIEASMFDIIDFEEDDKNIKILIDGWISIRKKHGIRNG